MFRKTCTPSFCYTVAAIGCFLFFQLISNNASAQGNLLITPRRVVFEGAKRSEDLNLANTGQDTATYVVSFIQIRMKGDGSFERIETPDSGQRFADPYLRLFPRTVTLPPGEAQTVKLQVRRTAGMEAGEYRSHLYFRAVPRQKPLGEKGVEQDSSISVKLTPIFGISIPVIVREGQTDAAVLLQEARLQNDSVPVLHLNFQRSGNVSVYGDIQVNHISRQGKITPVGAAKGFAIYTPNAGRQFALPLLPSMDYHNGKLQVIYAGTATNAPRLAEKEILLN